MSRSVPANASATGLGGQASQPSVAPASRLLALLVQLGEREKRLTFLKNKTEKPCLAIDSLDTPFQSGSNRKFRFSILRHLA
jgi:hypothetical protein